MKYYFAFEKSNEDISTLIVYVADDYPLFGSSPRLINVLTGIEAEKIYRTLTEKAKGENNGQASNS